LDAVNIPYPVSGCTRRAWLRPGLGFAILVILAATACGQERVIPRESHPWARFRPGSWKLVRVTTESFDEAGKPASTSVTETKTMLLSVDATTYELQIDVTVDVAGKKFASEPKVTRQGFQGEGDGQKATVRPLGDRELTIGDRKFTAHTAEIEIGGKDSRKVTWLYYLPGSTPYILARRSMTFDADGKLQQETQVESKKLQAWRTLLGFRRSTWETTTTQKHAAGRIVTDEVHCLDIPGGVVGHTSEEFDEKERLVRRSKLELVNFGVATPDMPLRFRRPQRKSRRRNDGLERRGSRETANQRRVAIPENPSPWAPNFATLF